MEEQIAEDNAAIDDYRAKFGDAEAAKFAAQLYILRRTPPPAATSNTSGWSGLPRWLIILIAVWVGLLETADKLPQLMLTIPQYEANLAELHAKLLQPDLATAQLEKAKFDAKAAAFQPDLASVQLDKTRLDTKAAAFAPDTAAAQLTKTQQDARASVFQPATAEAALEKTKQEARAAKWQPLATAAQGLAAEGQFVSNGNLDSSYVNRMTRTLGRLKPFEDLVLDDPPKPEPTPTEAATPEPTPTPSPTPSAPATPEPSPTPTPTPLRTPANFDCINGKHMGTDYVICGSPQLLDAEARLEGVYRAARAGANGDRIKAEQIDWIKHYGPDCGLPLRGQPSESLIETATPCVLEAMERRIRELQQEQ